MSELIDQAPTGGKGGGLIRGAVRLSLPAFAVACRLQPQGKGQASGMGVLGLHQITLAASNVECSLDFYRRLFGMPVPARHGTSVLLRIGDGPHFLALTEAGPATRPPLRHGDRGVRRGSCGGVPA